MLSRLLDPRTGKPREPAFWLILVAVMAAQLLAFYLLCSRQVHKAEVRRAQAEVERMAHSDCLQYLANATIGTCAQPLAGAAAAAPAAEPAGDSGRVALR